MIRVIFFVVTGLFIGLFSLNFLNSNPTPCKSVVVVGSWPPVLNSRYPDLMLSDQNGRPCQLSEFEGKTILLELAAIPCKGCQAFAGGKQYGGYAGVAVQPNLDSIHTYVKRYAGFDMKKDDDVVFVQLMLYGKNMQAPTEQEVSGWAAHFNMHRSDNEIVLNGDPSMLNRSTFEMIPGFHLIDKDFILKSDSSGHHPKQDLYRELLPALGRMAKE